jgi:hypothetical protein
LCTNTINVERKKPVLITFRNYKKINWERLGTLTVESFDSEIDLSSSLDHFTSLFISKHVQIYDDVAPILTKSIKPCRIPKTISFRTKRLIYFRNSLQAKHKRQPGDSLLAQIKAINGTIRRSVNLDTKEHLDNEINTNGVWAVKKKLFSSDSCTVNFDKDQLVNYFSSVSNEPASLIFPSKPSQVEFSCKFFFSPISKVELLCIYKEMKNKLKHSADVTGLAPVMLANTIDCPSVSDDLLHIVNSSFRQREFPDCLKTSCITPIPKCKNPVEMSDFRPISTQPFLGLLIEKSAKKQLISYLIKNDILYRGQFGFRPSHSCETAMVALTEFMYREINKGNICILVSLDLAKAFDKIVREFLYEKLQWYGIDPAWFKSYFEYRCHFVKGRNGSPSQVQFTIRGTGQGTILGPIIFCIYINDLPSVIKYCLCILLADDTQLCIAGDPRKIGSLLERVRLDLLAVVEWMSENGMALHVSKTQLIVVGNASNVARVGQVSLDINGTVILSSDCIKSLGLQIDSKLSWSHHINSLSRCFHFMAKSLYPLKPVLSIMNFMRIIEACVICLTNYMVFIWGNASTSNI